MQSLVHLPVLFAQAAEAPRGSIWINILSWLQVFGEPQITLPGFQGALLGWVKVVGLYCLMGWVLAWIVKAYKEQRSIAKSRVIDVIGLIGLVGFAATVLWQILIGFQRAPNPRLLGFPIVGWLTGLAVFLVFVWIERAVWAAVVRLGGRLDFNTLCAMHVALAAGVVVAVFIRRVEIATQARAAGGWGDAIQTGFRYGASFMGFVVLLRVLAVLLPEIWALRWRRLYSIAWLTIKESNRRMWAPYVVLAVFLIVLAFTNWFLPPPMRAAEFGRSYVRMLMFLCSLLLTLMIVILTPISIPSDITRQTIYTVVSKPVHRLELVWGRLLGYMAMMTVLVLAFGGICLAYLSRTVGGEIRGVIARADQARDEKRPAEEKQLREQAEQMRTRMAARTPIKGSLTFIDSRGFPKLRGVDVGQELEFHSYIEGGGTKAKAIWSFGIIENPVDRYLRETAERAGTAPPSRQYAPLDKRVPVDLFLEPGTIEYTLNLAKEAEYRAREADQQRRALEAAGGSNEAGLARVREIFQTERKEIERLGKELSALAAKEREILASAAESEKAGKDAEAMERRDTAARLHSPDVPIEMIFTVYRTTKGRVGDPVFAELRVANPYTGDPFIAVFPVHEYYTNREMIPSLVLAGSRGALEISVRCLNDTQYLGMSESDLYILASNGDFSLNFMKGLFGVWLQAMILTAIGVFAGTFLSWPVAVLMTFMFWLAGLFFYTFLLQISAGTLLGGGPFESLVRELTHNNQMNELSGTAYVIAAKVLDQLVMPVLSKLAFLIPNISLFDFRNSVANGYAVSNSEVLSTTMLALGYVLPFSISGFLVLKNREVAA